MRRRLAAILAADVVDFTRLMGEDELGTLQDVKRVFGQLAEPSISARGGRIFKTMGDGLLAIFDSAVEAVAAAHEIQQDLAAEASLALRIGIHSGDVLIDGDDTFGESVNIAARLQAFAEPREIIVSHDVCRAVRRKLPVHFRSRGTPTLKNISEPMEVFALVTGAEPEAPPVAVPARPAAAVGEDGPMAAGQPSIIVLPFANLSRDPDQEFFCDGLTQDVTTDLSKFSELFVFAANSAFTFKGRAVRPNELARDLGVRYLLEGSVQKAGNMIRLNAQLIEAESERHLWADRIDRNVDDLLAAQDELVRRIVATLAVRVTASEMERVSRRETGDINAYFAFLRGTHLYLQQIEQSHESESGLLAARDWFRRATEIDPDYARAWGWLGYTEMNRVLEGWAEPAAAVEAEAFAKRAVALSPDDHDTHWALGFVYSATGRPGRGLAEFEESRRINPNDANMLVEMAETLTQLGRHAEALAQIRNAFALNPYAPPWYRWMLGWALHHARDYQGSIDELERILAPNNEVRLILAANHARLAATQDGAAAERHRTAAEQYRADFIARRPDWTVEKERRTNHFEVPADSEHWLEGLRLAGVPS